MKRVSTRRTGKVLCLASCSALISTWGGGSGGRVGGCAGNDGGGGGDAESSSYAYLYPSSHSPFPFPFPFRLRRRRLLVPLMLSFHDELNLRDVKISPRESRLFNLRQITKGVSY